MPKEPLRVAITGGGGQIGYSLLYQISSGYVFGCDQPLILQLLETPHVINVLRGVIMELHDCALPLLKDIIETEDPMIAFKDADVAFLVGAFPRKKGMERKDLLSANVKIFKIQGQAIDKVAKKNIKVMVVGNPANTNAVICAQYAPSIPKENFSAMTRLDMNRAKGQLALKAGVCVDKVKNVIIWGNHSSTQYPDYSHATIGGKPVTDVIKDEEWLTQHFIPKIQKRGAEVIAARLLSSAMSAAKAACDHFNSWWFGTSPGEFVSMAVYSNGSYGAPEGVMFSFPVTIDPKTKAWKIVEGLSMSDFSKEKISITAQELQEEKDEAFAICNA